MFFIVSKFLFVTFPGLVVGTITLLWLMKIKVSKKDLLMMIPTMLFLSLPGSFSTGYTTTLLINITTLFLMTVFIKFRCSSVKSLALTIAWLMVVFFRSIIHIVTVWLMGKIVLAIDPLYVGSLSYNFLGAMGILNFSFLMYIFKIPLKRLHTRMIKMSN